MSRGYCFLGQLEYWRIHWRCIGGILKILILGDTHADANHVRYALQQALEAGCEQIIQLGDFGYFPRLPEGQRFLEQISNPPLLIYWVDGNHEDHESLNHAATEPVEVAPNIFYLPRGYCWRLGDLKALALGGAYSIDQAYRTLGHTYFVEETLRTQDIQRALSAETVDIIFSHDCPIGVDLTQHLNRRSYRTGKYPLSDANRKDIQGIVEALNPFCLFHGHHHASYSARLQLPAGLSCSVRGLDRNQKPEKSWIILDTDQLKNEIWLDRGVWLN